MIANVMIVRRLIGLQRWGWLWMRRWMREFNGTDPELVNKEKNHYVRVRFRTRLETETGGDG